MTMRSPTVGRAGWNVALTTARMARIMRGGDTEKSARGRNAAARGRRERLWKRAGGRWPRSEIVERDAPRAALPGGRHRRVSDRPDVLRLIPDRRDTSDRGPENALRADR